MKQKRRRYSGVLKAKVGLEAVMGIKTTSQIAREHQVHPLLVTQWKRYLLDRLPGIFERGQQSPDERKDDRATASKDRPVDGRSGLA